jgi:hypothetical protein
LFCVTIFYVFFQLHPPSSTDKLNLFVGGKKYDPKANRKIPEYADNSPDTGLSSPLESLAERKAKNSVLAG